MKYVIKNCDNYTNLDEDWTCRSTIQNRKGCFCCQDCTDCVMKQIVDKLREADNSCDGIDCTECSGFYMCHSKFANDVLKLFDIQEVE